MPAVARALVGRAAELTELSQALERARSGSSSLVLLRGEPGIGKTRLCEELADTARAAQVHVAWGRCWETPGAPAYWPWVQLYDELALEAPELQRLLAGEDGPAEANRYRLYQLSVGALREAAAKRPLLLVFEDLHAADLPSVALLHHAARTLKGTRIMWLATARDRDPRLTDALEGVLARLAREGVRVQPSRLQPPEIAELARSLLDRTLPEAAVQQVARATEGTPLFVEGTLKLIGGRAEVSPLPLPQSANDVLRDRLDLMPPQCRELLELAAVVGHVFSRPLLVTASGRAPRKLDEELAPAVKAGLLRETSVDELGFAHALLREALYRALPPRRCAELHHVVLTALLQRRVSAEELAHHALSALPLGDPDEALALTVKAARAAEGLLAFDRATALYERALAATEVEGVTPRRTDLLIALAHAHVGAARRAAAIATAERAATFARGLEDGERLAAAALASGAVFRLGAVDPALVSLLEEALAALGDRHPKLAVKVKARLASALQPAHDPSGPVKLAYQAIAEARALGDPATLMAVLHFGLSAVGDLTDAAERIDLLHELVALAARHKDKVLEHRSWARLAIAAWELGDTATPDRCVRELERLAAELGPSWRLLPLLFRSLRAIIEGRFADDDRIMADIVSLADECGSSEMLNALGPHQSARILLQGRADDVGRGIAGMMQSMAGTPAQETGADHLIAAYAFLAFGDVERARPHWERVPEKYLTYPDRGALFWGGLCAGLLGDVRRAAMLEPVLKPLAERFATGGLIAVSVDGPMFWPLGLLAAAQGRREEGLELLDRAVARCRDIGARALAARALYHRARLAEQLGRPEAHEQLAFVAREAAAMDMPVLQRAAQPASPAPTQEPVAAPEEVHLRRDGEIWLLRAGPLELKLKDSRGMQMLATLLEQPGREVHVLELSGSDATAGGDAGEVLDATAKAEYRERLESLRDELEEARQFNDPGRAARLQEEIEFLTDELAAGVGLGGRSRKAASNVERARVNVQRRIKDALKRIEEQAPELGRRLGRFVRTGTTCVFEKP